MEIKSKSILKKLIQKMYFMQGGKLFFVLIVVMIIGMSGCGVTNSPLAGEEKEKFFSTQTEIAHMSKDSDQQPVAKRQEAVFPVVSEFPKELNELGFVPHFIEQTPTVETARNLKAIDSAYGLKLTGAEKDYLNKNKFVLLPLNRSTLARSVNFDEMLAAFDGIQGSDFVSERSPENAKLVTPDVVLHSYHRFFELTLEQLEGHELGSTLHDFLVGLSDNLVHALKNSPVELKNSYERLLAQITVARVLLENQNPPPPSYFSNGAEESAYKMNDEKVDNLQNALKIFSQLQLPLSKELHQAVETELTSIYKADTLGRSPLFAVYNDALITDYTQFTPRSHYTKNSALRAYFRTMMYLGRSSYALKKDVGFVDSNLLTEQFMVADKSGNRPFDDWKKIMNLTAFYAGQSDDITYTEWEEYVTRVLGRLPSSSLDRANADTIKQLASRIGELRQPKILSDVIFDEAIATKTKADLLRSTLGFRIFGQRFTFDAWVLNNLTAGDESTSVRLPSTPSAVFLPAAFGSSEAREAVKKLLEDAQFSTTEQAGFARALDNEKEKLSKIKPSEWFGSLQSAWVYVLGSLTSNYAQGFPAYMQTKTFLDKQIQTFLGSYTELKHDTLLYAKQSYAEKGGGPEDGAAKPVVRGFVEPDVLFWRKLLFLIDFNQKLFKENHVLEDSSALARLQEFQKEVVFCRDIAEKELRGQKVSDEEYETLRRMSLSFMAAPFETGDASEETAKVGLIADIHTDASVGQILYEATGQPYLMLALVGNDNDERAVLGTVFNHYELTAPLTTRLTDEVWKKRVYQAVPDLPMKNAWYESLLVK